MKILNIKLTNIFHRVFRSSSLMGTNIFLVCVRCLISLNLELLILWKSLLEILFYLTWKQWNMHSNSSHKVRRYFYIFKVFFLFQLHTDIFFSYQDLKNAAWNASCSYNFSPKSSKPFIISFLQFFLWS